jgi:hypothetical protein
MALTEGEALRKKRCPGMMFLSSSEPLQMIAMLMS